MAQHDMVVDVLPGLPFRNDMNNAFAALFSNSSGPTPPPTTRLGQMWFDTSRTTVSTLWIRNNANTAWIKMFDIDETGIIGMGFPKLDEVRSINGGPLQGVRNMLINGDFDIWQRGIFTNLSGYNTADRWATTHVGSSKVINQIAFTPGQTDVPGNPKYFIRNTVSVSAATTDNYVALEQRCEAVQTFAGKTVTITFYAKADAPKNIAVELGQYYGSGGSPSSPIHSIGMTTCTLSTVWKKFTWSVKLPTLAGKILGTNNNDYMRVTYWFDAGTNHNARTNNLGSQTGVFDIAHVSLVEGDATQEDDPFSPRPLSREFQLCQRYFETSYNLASPLGTITVNGMINFRVAILASLTTHNLRIPVPFKTRKRIPPTLTIYSPLSGASGMATSYVGTDTDVVATAGHTGDGASSVGMADTRAATEMDFGFHWAAAAEL